jgi:putative flippase GtrA
MAVIFLPLLFEFLRYSMVGGLAFIIDFGVLYLAKTYLFSALETAGILLATALGFIAGLIFNYILSFIFVFKKIDAGAQQHKIRSFILFSGIGVIGLALTEAGMYVGIRLFGHEWYLFLKVIIAGIVLAWNYLARKILIFKGAQYGQK